MKQSHVWTTARLVNYLRGDAHGFTADSCGACKKTANVPAFGSGWFCACGAYNVLPFHGHQMPHEHPNLGPTPEALAAARALLIAPSPPKSQG